MAKLLCVSCGMPSVLYPTVELARRLAVDGHAVTFAGLPSARDLLEHHGIPFVALEPSGYDRFLEEDARSTLPSKLVRLRDRRSRAQGSLRLECFSQALEELAPELVLIDGEMHEHVIRAAGAGVPIALLNSFASIWRAPGQPPPHHFVQPGVGWKGTSAGIALLWLALRLRKKRTRWKHWLQRGGCDRVSLLRQLARHEGFDWNRYVDSSQWLMPCTYRFIPQLSLHAREFEFPHRTPDWVHFIGPQLLEARVDRPMPQEERTRLDALLQRHRTQEGHTLIYAGFGSVLSTDLSLLQRLLGVVQYRESWELVISLSDRVDVNKLGPLPERAHVFSWVPQRELLQDADIAVSHGGINTIDECVASGVPMLLYRGGETDMAGNSARVAHHGIGIVGDREHDQTKEMREHLDRLLSEPHFGEKLDRLRQAYAAYAEERVTERVVASLLDGTQFPRETGP